MPVLNKQAADNAAVPLARNPQGKSMKPFINKAVFNNTVHFRANHSFSLRAITERSS